MSAGAEVTIRPLDELDIADLVRIDERIGGQYRPELWERRASYYLRRDPEVSQVAEVGGRVVGFMLGEVRSGEFGLDEPTGWIEVLGIDPDHQGKAIGRRLFEAMAPVFRDRGAHRLSTIVDADMPDIERFFSAVGFAPAPSRVLAMELGAPATTQD